ncbi:MAG TPA: GNAT family N-acetyltransferase [Tepidisphaeraceae bacterium]|nr:GNAT family N-acetyltransferase [Tepidisphaeraceae bacterium]
MHEIACTSSAVQLPAPRVPIAIRTATMSDLPFLDAMQKKHSRALGYFPTKQFEGYIEMGGVLVAEAEGMPVGYCISRDRYLKRDELGVIYQLCVAPGDQRKLIGASLIKATIERSAYGCRLYCCWCAQDLDANYFWESMGFVPIAFRAGSTGKKRVHIFWQRPIVDGDATPWWYPFKTDSGAIREDRLVFPIPPGVHWRDIRPPDVRAVEVPRAELALNESADKQKQPSTRKRANARAAVVDVGVAEMGGFWSPAPKPGKKPREQKHKAPAAKAAQQRSRRIDPKYLAAARELRDRWMERVNDRSLLDQSCGKYDLSRVVSEAEGSRGIMEAEIAGAKPAGLAALPVKGLPLRQGAAAAA